MAKNTMQMDIEMLFLHALEKYAQIHHILEKETLKLFQEYQVYEKLVAQYEILHQVDFSETMKYIDEIIQHSYKRITLYHGSNVYFKDVDLMKSNNRRDFGKGFYCTVLEKQAYEWAYRLYKRKHYEDAYIYKFTFYQSKDLKIKRFTKLDKDWLEFIKENRSKGGIQHSYDVVIGPVADDKTMETIQLYLSGILTSKEAVERLRYSEVNNQVSFHTKKALEHLEFVEVHKGGKRYER